MTRITRIEVIDENGRSYTNWKDSNDIVLSYQDDGRTLKVFVNTAPHLRRLTTATQVSGTPKNKMIISTVDLLSLFEKAGQLDLSVFVKDDGDGHYLVKFYEMFGKDFEELLMISGDDGSELSGPRWTGCDTVGFNYLMQRFIDALKAKKEAELKEKRRKAILSNLTDEQKELLGISG